MRRRMLNPDFFTDPDIVANLDAYGRLLYQGMWCVADDSGCLELNPLLLKMKVLPGDETVSIDDIRDYFDKLIELNKIITYKVDGKEYGWLKNFHKHQSLNKPNAPSVPLPKWITWHGESEKRHERYYEVEYEEYKINLEGQGTDNGKTVERQQKDMSCPEEKLKEVKRSKEKLKEENKEDEEENARTKLANFYQKVFNRQINGHQWELIKSYIDDGLSERIIILAIKEASLNNADGFNYITTVLDDWISKDLYTMMEVKQYLKERKNSSSKNKDSPDNKVEALYKYAQSLEKEGLS